VRLVRNQSPSEANKSRRQDLASEGPSASEDHRLSRCPGIKSCLVTDVPGTRCVGVVDVETFETSQPDHRTRPWLGLRRRPGRAALAIFRTPLPLYRAGWGWLLGRTFLLLVHAGRKTGQPHAMTAMVLRYDVETHEAVICSGWGPTTDWIRNIRARPALKVTIGRSHSPHCNGSSTRKRASQSRWSFACATQAVSA
jgi:deazaflavin-dependent oxidoreductase (nitroreductase family)